MLPAILFAEETSCRGKLGAVTVDNLRIPERAQCVLTNKEDQCSAF
jgi:hypothetical protein